jgi:hypothetical protein
VLELDAGVVRGEAPIGLGVAEVAVFDPGADLADEGFVVWDAPIEALGSHPSRPAPSSTANTGPNSTASTGASSTISTS